MNAETQDLGILLGLAYQGFVQELRGTLAATGVPALGRSDGYVFRALADGPVNITALAESLQISKQGAAQIVDDMEERGLVVRETDPADRRSRLVRLTADGAAALGTAREFHRAYEQRLGEILGAATVAGLRSALTEMAGESGLHDARIRALYL